MPFSMALIENNSTANSSVPTTNTNDTSSSNISTYAVYGAMGIGFIACVAWLEMNDKKERKARAEAEHAKRHRNPLQSALIQKEDPQSKVDEPDIEAQTRAVAMEADLHLGTPQAKMPSRLFSSSPKKCDYLPLPSDDDKPKP
jgi:hypothetical protein